jgi:hypothetical protein
VKNKNKENNNKKRWKIALTTLISVVNYVMAQKDS